MKKMSLFFALLLAGCVGLPEGVRPVENFILEKYLGKWYEIARLDHSFELEQNNYSCALVCGPNRTYLWLLARSPRIDDDLKRRLIAVAANLGFDTGKLIFVRQDGV